METRDLPGWPGYFVTSAGEIYGPRGKPLRGYKDRYGYHCVSLGPRGKAVGVKVHRAVMSGFLGGIPEGMHVNHRNGNKLDNRIENLEVNTPAENVRHTYSTLGRKGTNTNPVKGSGHHNSILTEDDARKIRKLYREGWTQVDLASRFKTRQTNISMIVRRTAWAHVTD